MWTGDVSESLRRIVLLLICCYDSESPQHDGTIVCLDTSGGGGDALHCRYFARVCVCVCTQRLQCVDTLVALCVFFAEGNLPPPLASAVS
jgi:hypothetical protein